MSSSVLYQAGKEVFNLVSSFIPDLLVHNTVEDEDKEAMERIEYCEDIGESQ